jgi:hypothetical protein
MCCRAIGSPQRRERFFCVPKIGFRLAQELLEVSDRSFVHP